MSKESKCFDSNTPKQKKHYAKWKKFIGNLNDDKTKEKKVNEKKNFQDYFQVDTVIKFRNINNLDYQPFFEGA